MNTWCTFIKTHGMYLTKTEPNVIMVSQCRSTTFNNAQLWSRLLIIRKSVLKGEYKRYIRSAYLLLSCTVNLKLL